MRISDWSSDVCSSDLVLVQHSLGIVPQFGKLKLVVGQHHNVELLVGCRHALEVCNHGMCAVDCRHVGATLIVVRSHMHFVLGNGVHKPGDALSRVGGVAAVGIAGHTLVECVIGFTQAFRVELAWVLAGGTRESGVGWCEG